MTSMPSRGLGFAISCTVFERTAGRAQTVIEPFGGFKNASKEHVKVDVKVDFWEQMCPRAMAQCGAACKAHGSRAGVKLGTTIN